MKNFARQPQSNEVRARFDLLTSFRHGERSLVEWHNAVQTQIALSKYLPETAKILHRDIFWFFLRDEDFLSRTINEGNIDLNMFPLSRVRQLAKKRESSKAMAKHMKNVSSDPQAAHINLLRCQCTAMQPSKFQKNRRTIGLGKNRANKKTGKEGFKRKTKSHSLIQGTDLKTPRSVKIEEGHTQAQIDARNVVSQHT